MLQWYVILYHFYLFITIYIDSTIKDATIGIIEYVSVLFDELEVHG